MASRHEISKLASCQSQWWSFLFNCMDLIKSVKIKKNASSFCQVSIFNSIEVRRIWFTRTILFSIMVAQVLGAAGIRRRIAFVDTIYLLSQITRSYTFISECHYCNFFDFVTMMRRCISKVLWTQLDRKFFHRQLVTSINISIRCFLVKGQIIVSFELNVLKYCFICHIKVDIDWIYVHFGQNRFICIQINAMFLIY